MKITFCFSNKKISLKSWVVLHLEIGHNISTNVWRIEASLVGANEVWWIYDENEFFELWNIVWYWELIIMPKMMDSHH
jgi:hypothetical protein